MFFAQHKQMTKILGQVDQWLQTAVAHAQAKSFDPNVFIDMRLTPDQFPFVRQVQSTCDTAKLASARITGKDAPSHPDTERTIDELRARIASVIAYHHTFTEADFAGVADRVITNPRWEGMVMSGPDYYLEHAIPNFYFHSTHTYAILRHNGVNLGKRDFLGALNRRAP